MTPQEEQLLEGLIQRVQQTQLGQKDQQAEQVLRQTLGQNPDALYILCQTVLVQQYALEQAQKQIAALREQQQQLQQPQHTSFLGGLFGGGQQSAPPPPPPQMQQPQYAPVQYGGPVYSQGYAPSGGGGFGGGGGFLQGAMQTAAGVVAGEMVFRGIEDLMHGFGHEAGYGSDRDMGGFGGQQPEVINNNYYGSDSGGSGGGFGDRLQAADGDTGISPDVEDRRNDLADTDTGQQDDGQNFDDSSQDDFSGSDDSGGDPGGSDDQS